MTIFIRHAESYYNGSKREERDVGLNPAGILQAQKLNYDVDLVICSKLKRAVQTLHYSKIKYADVIYTSLCREIRNGHVTGLFPNEENIKDTKENILENIKELKKIILDAESNGKKVLVISHSMFLYELTKKYIYNAQVIEFDCNEKLEE